MSYDIFLKCPVTGHILEVDQPHQMRGGTYQVGGSHELRLNVTWNYAPHFYRLLGDKGIRSIYGLTGAESIPLLDGAISELGDDVNSDYWQDTEGNVKQALCHLRAMAAMRPDGVWSGD